MPLGNKEKLSSLLDKREKVYAKLEAITGASFKEDRAATEEEKEQYRALEAEFNTLTTDIEDAESRVSKDELMAEARSRGMVTAKSTEKREVKPDFQLGDILCAISQEARGMPIDSKFSEYQKRSLSSNVPSEGGWLIGQDQTVDLVQSGFETSVFAQRCNVIQVGPQSNGLRLLKIKGNSRETGSRFGGIRVYWLGEGDTITGSNPKFEEKQIRLNKIAAYVTVPEEVLQDATALGSWIRSEFPREFAFALDDAIMHGTGVGQPLGFMNSGAKVTAPKEDGQAANTFTYNNFVEMEDYFDDRTGGEIFINREVRKQIRLMAQIIGAGGVPVFQPASPAGSERFADYGTPIKSEHCEALGTEGDIVLADMSQYDLIEKGGLRYDESMHVEFVRDMMAFRFIKRVGGATREKEPLTPYKGSSGKTYGNFVTLATRA